MEVDEQCSDSLPHSPAIRQQHLEELQGCGSPTAAMCPSRAVPGQPSFSCSLCTKTPNPTACLQSILPQADCCSYTVVNKRQSCTWSWNLAPVWRDTSTTVSVQHQAACSPEGCAACRKGTAAQSWVCLRMMALVQVLLTSVCFISHSWKILHSLIVLLRYYSSNLKDYPFLHLFICFYFYATSLSSPPVPYCWTYYCAVKESLSANGTQYSQNSLQANLKFCSKAADYESKCLPPSTDWKLI